MPRPKIDPNQAATWPYILTCPQAAEILGVSHSKVYRMAREGQIPSIRFGQSTRIPRQLFLEWVEGKARASAL